MVQRQLHTMHSKWDGKACLLRLQHVKTPISNFLMRLLLWYVLNMYVTTGLWHIAVCCQHSNY